MPLRPSKTVAIPQTSIPTFVFGSHSTSLRSDPIILDAARPDDRFLSLHSYRTWSQCFASGLRKNGLCVGDRVLFVAGNTVAWPVVFMGTLMAGGILSGASPALPATQLVRMARELDPALIISSEDAVDAATETAQTIGLGDDKLIFFDPECLFTDPSTWGSPKTTPRLHLWSELLDLDGRSFDWTPFISSPNQLAAINYTSGSTGFSKGVMVSHRNILANACQYLEQQKDDPFAPEYGNPTNWLSWVPFYHVVGQNQFCVISPKRGIRNYIMDKFTLDAYLMYTEKYRPAHWYMLPPLMITLLSHPAAKSYDLSSVRNVMVSGAPLRLALSERFESFMPHEDCRVVQGWGMTELTCVAVNRNPRDRTKTQSVGELLPNVEAKVMTQDGRTEITEPNRSGELWIRSPNVAQGYWNNPERTCEVYLPDGWLRTGDFGYYDEHEQLFVSDRLQDIVFVESPPGTFILPTDLEGVLLEIPGIVDAGVTSVSLPNSLERVPRGFVVVEQSADLTVEEINSAFNAQVREHERLRGGLFVIDAIPRVPSGKVNRAALRELQTLS